MTFQEQLSSAALGTRVSSKWRVSGKLSNVLCVKGIRSNLKLMLSLGVPKICFSICLWERIFCKLVGIHLSLLR